MPGSIFGVEAERLVEVLNGVRVVMFSAIGRAARDKKTDSGGAWIEFDNLIVIRDRMVGLALLGVGGGTVEETDRATQI